MFITYDIYVIVKNFYHNNSKTKIITTIIIIIDIIIMSLHDFHLTKIEFIINYSYWGIGVLVCICMYNIFSKLHVLPLHYTSCHTICDNCYQSTDLIVSTANLSLETSAERDQRIGWETDMSFTGAEAMNTKNSDYERNKKISIKCNSLLIGTWYRLTGLQSCNSTLLPSSINA